MYVCVSVVLGVCDCVCVLCMRCHPVARLDISLPASVLKVLGARARVAQQEEGHQENGETLSSLWKTPQVYFDTDTTSVTEALTYRLQLHW